MKDSDINPLLTPVINKDIDAFREFYERTADHVYRTVYYLVNNKNEVNDIVSDIYIALLAALPYYDRNKPFRAWLNGLIINQVNNWSRKGWRRLRIFNRNKQLHVSQPWKRPDELAIEAEEKDNVLELVNSLSLKLREVIVLRYYQDCSFDEIASTLQIPLGTAKSRHHEALKKLRIRTSRSHFFKEAYHHAD
ncbi:sigma-70 family RNA polymerase sigma factor [Candidatus Pristimantibacillus sp. PTI5]|uniref:sigma-70 family RNA polymerase sigma factor n=1 Tax=Candidatus Pristimantibacillus sp. PTI5 TaxID=3400422 RepID=UPI003B0196D8